MVSESATIDPIVYINGKRYVLPTGKAEWTLLQYLRGRFVRVSVALHLIDR